MIDDGPRCDNVPQSLAYDEDSEKIENQQARFGAFGPPPRDESTAQRDPDRAGVKQPRGPIGAGGAVRYDGDGAFHAIANDWQHEWFSDAGAVEEPEARRWRKPAPIEQVSGSDSTFGSRPSRADRESIDKRNSRRRAGDPKRTAHGQIGNDVRNDQCQSQRAEREEPRPPRHGDTLSPFAVTALLQCLELTPCRHSRPHLVGFPCSRRTAV